MNDKEKRERANKYKNAYDTFEEVGAGPDSSYKLVMFIASGIKQLCRQETGYEILWYAQPLKKVKK